MHQLVKKILSFSLTVVLLFISGCSANQLLDNQAYETAEPVITSEPVNELPIQTPSPTPYPTPRQGGKITLSMRLPQTLNPLLNEDITIDNILKLIFEPISILDEELRPVANKNLVDSITFSQDGLNATIILRNDVVWSDGVRVSADDLIFSLDFLRKAGDNAIYKKNLENIRNYQAVNDSTVIIFFDEPLSSTPYLLSFPIIPKHYYESEYDMSSYKNMNPIGNGKYEFSSYILARKMSLVASESRDAYISEINVLITPDYKSDMLCFDQGLIDAVPANYSNWGKYKGARNANSSSYVTRYFDFIGFNFNIEMFQSLEIRKAIARLIPYDDIISDVYLNYAVKSLTPVSPESWLFEPDIYEYSLDIEASAEILSGRKINVLVNEENEERIRIASILKQNLEKAGVSTIVRSVPFEQFEDMLEKGQFDIFIGGFVLSDVPDFNFMFHSDSIPEKTLTETEFEKETETEMEDDEEEDTENEITTSKEKNYFSYSNEEMDRLLSDISSAVESNVYKQSMSDLQKHIASNLPIIGLAFRKTALLTDKNILGELKPNATNAYANINEWFIY